MTKDAILGTIRRGLKRGPLPADQRAMLEGRLAAHPRHIIPARSRLPRAEQVALFIRNVEKEFGSVERVADAAAHAPQGGEGAYVGHVRPGSTAERAGVQAGDVIIAIDGQSIRSADELIRAGKQLSHDQSIPLTIVRDGQYREVMLRS